jgi:hypothetical protein
MRYESINQWANPISSIRTMFRYVASAVAFIGHGDITSNANRAARNRPDPSSFVWHRRGKTRYGSWIAAATTLLLSGFYLVASANPVAEIIDGASWDLPIGESANIFLQRGWYQSSGTSYNANGRAISGPSTTEYIGLPSFAHFFFYDALPKVEFYWEVFQPAVNVEPPGHAQSVSGLGDPLINLSAYVRPIPNLLLGLENLTSIPVGNSNLTSHRFEIYPHIIADYKLGPLGFDGTFGAGIFASQHNGINSVKSGNLYFAETAVRYRLNPTFEPFITNTYQTQNSGTALFNDAYIPRKHQDDIGGGTKINFSHKRWISFWYYNTIDGKNVGKTNAVYFRFVNIF